MDDRTSPANPRLSILRREVDQTVLKPFRSHGWSARIVRETDGHDCIEVAAERGALATRIAVLYSSSGISKSDYGVLSTAMSWARAGGLWQAMLQTGWVVGLPGKIQGQSGAVCKIDPLIVLGPGIGGLLAAFQQG